MDGIKLFRNIFGYILAGGDSKRFGEDKALFEYEGMSMIKRTLNLLSPLVFSTKIVTKSGREFKDFGVEILNDNLDVQTPLAGVLRGLEDSEGWGLFLACDLPNMNSNVISRLLNSVNDSYEKEGITAIIASSADEELQPLVACYHKSGIASIKNSIEKNQSMKRWLSDSKIKMVTFEDEEPFININRKEDLSKL